MAYDEVLAERIRGLLPGEPVTEKKMFGGLGFMIGGHMAVAAGSKGSLMVRCDPADSERLLEEPGATRMVMRERELAGWLLVDRAALGSDEVLARWVRVGAAYVTGLPPKG